MFITEHKKLGDAKNKLELEKSFNMTNVKKISNKDNQGSIALIRPHTV